MHVLCMKMAAQPTTHCQARNTPQNNSNMVTGESRRREGNRAENTEKKRITCHLTNHHARHHLLLSGQRNSRPTRARSPCRPPPCMLRTPPQTQQHSSSSTTSQRITSHPHPPNGAAPRGTTKQGHPLITIDKVTKYFAFPQFAHRSSPLRAETVKEGVVLCS